MNAKTWIFTLTLALLCVTRSPAGYLASETKANEAADIKPATVAVPSTPRCTPVVDALVNASGLNGRLRTSTVESAQLVTYLADGRADVIALARPLTTEELRRIEDARKSRVGSAPVALDAVILHAHTVNPVTSLTMDDLQAVFNGRKVYWRQLGLLLPGDRLPGEEDHDGHGHEHRQEKPITVLMPESGSGTRGTIERVVLGQLALRPDVRSAPTEPKLLDALRADSHALACTGFGVESNTKIVPVRLCKDQPPIYATPETVMDHSYPLTHYAYLHYVGDAPPAVRRLAAFAVTSEGREAIRSAGTGMLPLPGAGYGAAGTLP